MCLKYIPLLLLFYDCNEMNTIVIERTEFSCMGRRAEL